jgi:RNA polymerase sigma factor (sigma-70 family)
MSARTYYPSARRECVTACMLERAQRARGVTCVREVDSFHVLYREFAAFVRAKLARFGVRSDDLRDLCHDVFLIAHKLREREEVRHVEHWLTLICWRTAAQHHRSSRRRRELVDIEELPDEALADESCAHDLERRNLARAVRGAFALLDQESRELLAMHAFGELPVTELSHRMQRDRKTVRKRLEVAKRRMTRLLEVETRSATLA